MRDEIILDSMAKKGLVGKAKSQTQPTKAGKPSSLLDTRVIYCGDNLEQLAKLPAACIDLIYISQIRRGGDAPRLSFHNA